MQCRGINIIRFPGQGVILLFILVSLALSLYPVQGIRVQHGSEPDTYTLYTEPGEPAVLVLEYNETITDVEYNASAGTRVSYEVNETRIVFSIIPSGTGEFSIGATIHFESGANKTIHIILRSIELSIDNTMCSSGKCTVRFHVSSDIYGLVAEVYSAGGNNTFIYNSLFPAGENTIQVDVENCSNYALHVFANISRRIDDWYVNSTLKYMPTLIAARDPSNPEKVHIVASVIGEPLYIYVCSEPSHICESVPGPHVNITMNVPLNDTIIELIGAGRMTYQVNDTNIVINLVYHGTADLYNPSRAELGANQAVSYLGVGLAVGVVFITFRMTYIVLLGKRGRLERGETVEKLTDTLMAIVGFAIIIGVGYTIMLGLGLEAEYGKILGEINMIKTMIENLSYVMGIPIVVIIVTGAGLIALFGILSQRGGLVGAIFLALLIVYTNGMRVFTYSIPDFSKKYYVPASTTMSMSLLLLAYTEAFIYFLYYIAIPLGIIIAALGLTIGRPSMTSIGGSLIVLYIVFPFFYNLLVEPAIQYMYGGYIAAITVDAVDLATSVALFQKDILGFGVQHWQAIINGELPPETITSYVSAKITTVFKSMARMVWIVNIINTVTIYMGISTILTVMISMEIVGIVRREISASISVGILSQLRRIFMMLINRIIFPVM